MTGYFGFIPSAQLKNNIDTARAKAQANGSELLYPYRDTVAKEINEELVENTLVQVVIDLPPNDKKETMLKLANFIKSTASGLLGQLLGKVDNAQALKSLAFLEQSVHQDPNGQVRVGFELPESLVDQMKASFAAVAAGEGKSQRDALMTQFKLFSDLAIKHYMEEFNKTLDLGMVKRGLASAAKGTITKAVHIAIDKLIPALGKEEMMIFAAHYDALIYKA
ncbi:MAG: hypothetical protein VXW65_14865 [Pseudomonadota bacterium]|nr:hypothetical protein [Pseudomonadota bacterium]